IRQFDVTRQGCRAEITAAPLQRGGWPARQAGSLFPALQEAMKPSGCAACGRRPGGFFIARRKRGRTMTKEQSSFWSSGHWPTLVAAFLYFDLAFMVWVILGPLAPAISE